MRCLTRLSLCGEEFDAVAVLHSRRNVPFDYRPPVAGDKALIRDVHGHYNVAEQFKSHGSRPYGFVLGGREAIIASIWGLRGGTWSRAVSQGNRLPNNVLSKAGAHRLLVDHVNLDPQQLPQVH